MSDEVLMRRPGVLEARVSEEELVLLGPDSEEYVGLDAIGSDIWARLERPMTFAELVALLASDYDATPARIAADLAPAIDALAEGGLLERRPAAG